MGVCGCVSLCVGGCEKGECVGERERGCVCLCVGGCEKGECVGGRERGWVSRRHGQRWAVAN